MRARPSARGSLTERQARGGGAPSAVRSHRWRRPGLFALLVLSLLVVASCDPNPYQGSPDGPQLTIVGDSLVCDIERQANDRFLYEGWHVSVTALGGYTVQDHEGTIRKVAATNPQVVVIALGANDIREISEGLQTYDEYRRDVRVTLDILRNVPFLVWVGVTTTNGYWGPDGDHRVVGPWINLITVVELAASGRVPGTTLYADWASESAGRMDYFVAPGNVHHSALGCAAYLDLIDRAAASFPGSPIQRPLDSVSVGPG
ncbi:SGNH/GDSL hydrolase family protein [Rhabdothermincola salaria]|uniref:SGNH/GDSL hydrolase family protein n=1 Tax=Rhabdothermincola salaria TaxID=2903142 RepID=UPI001E464AE2|nr:SGNH/GDSL hydrolase family protein [Rhabdothermincola salaria]MCD9623112.1 SGNH/GDSL hydrolase family protein [Rhabdothermincola salaria]